MKFTYQSRPLTGLILALMLSVLWLNSITANAYSIENLQPTRKQQHASLDVVALLKQLHYNKMKLDDRLSGQIFDHYIDILDPNRQYFLAGDIAEFSRFKLQIDDALQNGNLAPAFIIFNRYQQRLNDRLGKVIKQLQNGGIKQFDFNRDESYQTDRSKAAWVSSEKQLDDLWRKRLKHLILQQKLRDKKDEEIKTTLIKRFKNMLHRTEQANSEDAFQIYINAVTSIYDPHTTYFTPRESKNFDINMSLQLQGIGAVLQSEDEYTKVVRLVSGGPADKAGQLKPADKIVGVGQQHEAIVDVIGWRLDEVVERIRGKKGTSVSLEIIHADDESKTQTIEIVRDTVKLEDRAAQSSIIELPVKNGVQKFGVINLPAFYHDFKAMQDGDPEYRSSTRDLKRHITALKKQGIEGLIIDLRNNGGGSLQEAQKSVGLFIPTGPVVQVKSYKGIEPISDIDPKVFYDGPLVVVVNRLSASASEIFAGAIQDYHRGLVVGERTFGKGTVQSLQPLKYGKLKITLAKFYRISGSSNQHQGIEPDISFPSLFDFDEIGESALEHALPADKIRPAYYHAYPSIKNKLGYLQNAHNQRVMNNPDFIFVKDQIRNRNLIKNQTLVSLNKEKRIAEIKQAEQRRLAAENRKRVSKKQTPFKDIKALDAYNKAENERKASTSKQLEIDYILEESGQILKDMINLDKSKAQVAAK